MSFVSGSETFFVEMATSLCTRLGMSPCGQITVPRQQLNVYLWDPARSHRHPQCSENKNSDCSVYFFRAFGRPTLTWCTWLSQAKSALLLESIPSMAVALKLVPVLRYVAPT